MGRSSINRSNDEVEAEMRRGQAWWGIAGLVLLVAFLGIAYVLSAPLGESTIRIINGSVDPSTWRLFVGGAIFVLLISISGIFYAMFVPKRKEKFSERELDKERKLVRAEEQAKKDRQKQMRKQIAKARREGK